MTGAELKAMREAAGLTQKEAAARLRVTANALARLERGERSISPSFALLAELVIGVAAVPVKGAKKRGRGVA